MNLSRYLQWGRTAPQRRVSRPATPEWFNAAGSEPSAEHLDEVLLGCGWFDSSHVLNTGLQVTEYLTPEPVANEVPLGWWLDWQSDGKVAPCRLSSGPSGDGRAALGAAR
jgi:hypothetical protein